MALVCLLDKTNMSYDAAYLAHIKALDNWCLLSQLEINVAKTKELIICQKVESIQPI